MLSNKYTYIIINASYEGICVEFERKQHKIGFPNFKFPASTNNLF